MEWPTQMMGRVPTMALLSLSRSSRLRPFNVHLSTHSTRQCSRANQELLTPSLQRAPVNTQHKAMQQSKTDLSKKYTHNTLKCEHYPALFDFLLKQDCLNRYNMKQHGFCGAKLAMKGFQVANPVSALDRWKYMCDRAYTGWLICLLWCGSLGCFSGASVGIMIFCNPPPPHSQQTDRHTHTPPTCPGRCCCLQTRWWEQCHSERWWCEHGGSLQPASPEHSKQTQAFKCQCSGVRSKVAKVLNIARIYTPAQ